MLVSSQARFGDHKMFKHLLAKQTNILWRWGPVTKYEVSLDGIDSADAGEHVGAHLGVMEHVGAIFAERKTQTMLLDEFLVGVWLGGVDGRCGWGSVDGGRGGGAAAWRGGRGPMALSQASCTTSLSRSGSATAPRSTTPS